MKRTTRIATITAAATAVAIAGATYAVAQDGGTSLDGDSLDRATQAALAETGGGSVTGVEADDGGYDVEIRLDDGTEVDVDLDANFAVVRTSTEAPDRDDDDDAADADDRPLSDAERQQAIDAAVAEAGGGSVTGVEADDGGYDVEIRLDDGTEVDVDLDADFAIVRTSTEAPDQDDDDADDRALSDTERQQAIDAALAEAEGGEVIDVEADDGGYDVEIRLADGRQLDVELDADFKVLSSERDD